MTLSYTPSDVAIGGKAQPSVKPIPATAHLGVLHYTSGTVANATVNASTGEVTGVNGGTSIITVKTGGISATATVNVTKPPLTGITLRYSPTAITIGGKTQPTIVPVPSNADLGTITYSSANTSSATVESSTGEVTGVGNGSSVITAKSGTITSTATINVTKPQLTGITLTYTPSSIAVGAKATVVAEPIPVTADLGTVTYTSGTVANATVDSSSGDVTGVKAGASIITGTSGSIKGTATITVT